MRLTALNISLCVCIIVSTISLAVCVYPPPGSYYSVLLRFNKRWKARKEARIAPSPARLWAYFDPPKALGAVPIEAIDNNVAKYRGLSKRFKKSESEKDNLFMSTNNADEQTPLINNSEAKLHQIKAAPFNSNTQFSPDRTNSNHRKEKVSPLPSLKRVDYETKASQNAQTEALPLLRHRPKGNLPHESLMIPIKPTVNGTCSERMRISLTPRNTGGGPHGRYFRREIQTIGFPDKYEKDSNCTWTVEVGDKCEMGMLVFKVLDGYLMQTPECKRDSLTSTFNGIKTDTLCGELKGKTNSYKWTKSGHQTLELTLSTKQRDIDFSTNRMWGFRLALTGFCWVYSVSYLSMFDEKFFERKTKNQHQKRELKVDQDSTSYELHYYPNLEIKLAEQRLKLFNDSGASENEESYKSQPILDIKVIQDLNSVKEEMTKTSKHKINLNGTTARQSSMVSHRLSPNTGYKHYTRIISQDVLKNNINQIQNSATSKRSFNEKKSEKSRMSHIFGSPTYITNFAN